MPSDGIEPATSSLLVTRSTTVNLLVIKLLESSTRRGDILELCGPLQHTVFNTCCVVIFLIWIYTRVKILCGFVKALGLIFAETGKVGDVGEELWNWAQNSSCSWQHLNYQEYLAGFLVFDCAKSFRHLEVFIVYFQLLHMNFSFTAILEGRFVQVVEWSWSSWSCCSLYCLCLFTPIMCALWAKETFLLLIIWSFRLLISKCKFLERSVLFPGG